MQALEPVVRLLYVPAPHATHTAEAVAPTARLYAPAPHAVQPVDPVATALYVPAPQSVHAPLL